MTAPGTPRGTYRDVAIDREYGERLREAYADGEGRASDVAAGPVPGELHPALAFLSGDAVDRGGGAGG